MALASTGINHTALAPGAAGTRSCWHQELLAPGAAGTTTCGSHTAVARPPLECTSTHQNTLSLAHASTSEATYRPAPARSTINTHTCTCAHCLPHRKDKALTGPCGLCAWPRCVTHTCTHAHMHPCTARGDPGQQDITALRQDITVRCTCTAFHDRITSQQHNKGAPA
jgi:hypothetical protein